jgi:hypothetical protein
VSRGLSGYSADFQHFLSRWGDLIRKDDPYYNKNLGRFDPWCGFRAPGEDEEWLAVIEELTPVARTGDQPDDQDAGADSVHATGPDPAA